MKYRYTTELPTHFDFSLPLYIDTETYDNHTKIRLLQLYQPDKDETVYVVDVSGYPKHFLRSYLSQFKNIFGYNLLYDFEVLEYSFSDVPNFNDLYLASKLAFYERYTTPNAEWNLYAVIEDVLKIKIDIDKKLLQKSDFSAMLLTDIQIKYAAYDVYYLPLLKKAIEEKLNKVWTHNRVYRLDLFTAKTLLDIHRVGLAINKEKLQRMQIENSARLYEIKSQLPFNPLSPKQVANYFKTENANEKTLTYLASTGNKLAELVLEVRSLEKTKSFLEKYSRSERVFGKFNVVGAKSGRMSCSNENLQQIPRHLRQVFGFTEDSDKVYVIADFPQIELRLAAAIWSEDNMISRFKEGIDLHKYTASVIYNKSIEEVDKQERQISKSANFGLLYGMGAEKFKDYVFINTGIDLSIEEARTIRMKWLELFPAIRRKHWEVGSILSQTTYYEGTTWLGRKYSTSSYTEALNIQIQGSGAELLKTTVKNIYLKHKTSDFEIANLIHDEIVIETTKDKAYDIAEMLKQVMEESWQECINYAKIPLAKFDIEVEMPDITKSLEKS